MPVITRSQSKMLNQSRDNVHQRVNTEKRVNAARLLSFTTQIKELMDNVTKTTGVCNKMLEATKVYKMINRRLPRLIERNKKKWFKFTLTMFNKSYELENEAHGSIVDTTVLFDFTEELIKSRKILYDHYTKSTESIVWTN